MMSEFTALFAIFFAAAITNNFVFYRFLGICPFMGVSNKLSSAYSMGLAVTFVMVLSSLSTFLLDRFILSPFGLVFLRIVTFILVIAVLVQLIEMYLQKYSPDIYSAFGIYLPLITTNCTILGLSLLNIQDNNSFIHTIFFALGAGLGFTMALLIMASIRERLNDTGVPKHFDSVPIALIIAGLLALAFTGLGGLI